MASDEWIAVLRERGQILHEVTRYGAIYAVDSAALDKLFEDGCIPIVHMGQVAGVHALRQHRAHWLDVLLWCSRDATEQRARKRGSADIEQRLAVWDATLADLGSSGEPQFTLSIRTDVLTAATTAALVHAVMTSGDHGLGSV